MHADAVVTVAECERLDGNSLPNGSLDGKATAVDAGKDGFDDCTPAPVLNANLAQRLLYPGSGLAPLFEQTSFLARREGAVTSNYGADKQSVIKLLNEALATELVCVLRYKRHYFTAKGLTSHAVAQEFAAHAREEGEHADLIAERIVQLGGAPDFSPIGLAERFQIASAHVGLQLIVHHPPLRH